MGVKMIVVLMGATLRWKSNRNVIAVLQVLPFEGRAKGQRMVELQSTERLTGQQYGL